MTISRIGGLRDAARLLKKRLDKKALVLLYHRVVEVDTDPWLLCVRPQYFTEHLEVLKRYARPMRLQQLVNGLRDGQLPSRGVVVTFDDGYVDNLYNAKPLLERYDIPATVFVATGYIGHTREFWWDELDRLLLQPGTLPKVLHMRVNGETHEWRLGECANYGEDLYRRCTSWNMIQNDNPSPRHQIYRSLYHLLRPLREKDQRKVLDELLAWAGVPPGGRPTHRILSADETVALATGGLIEIGAHTVTHPILSSLAVDEQRTEVEQSKKDLEQILGYRVRGFAYPYGSRSDYTADTVSVVQATGHDYSCSAFDGVLRNGVDIFQLPRINMQNWDGDEFARRLEQWFRG